jgi:23S rRNA (uridine2552-2'-O)-methyltransferase
MADYKKLDYWSVKAQKEGYPARSVYKLLEMDEKFGLLKTGGRGSGGNSGGQHHEGLFRVLDLGAAPGSWSLYVLRKFKAAKSPAGLSLTAADLSPLSRQYDRGLFDGDNFFFIQGDITTTKTREAILARAPFSLLLSDAAPPTTGNRSVDTLRSLDLAEAALVYAENTLEPGGNMVIKVFQGEDTLGLLKRIRNLFVKGKSFKPQSCRRESFETYYLGLGKKGGG